MAQKWKVAQLNYIPVIAAFQNNTVGLAFHSEQINIADRVNIVNCLVKHVQQYHVPEIVRIKMSFMDNYFLCLVISGSPAFTDDLIKIYL